MKNGSKHFLIISFLLIAGGCSCEDRVLKDTYEESDNFELIDNEVTFENPEIVEDDATIDIESTDFTDEGSNPPLCPSFSILDIEIAGGEGEQLVPKAASGPNGSIWFSWYDNRNGNYDMRIQRLDTNGLPAFDVNGIVISNNPSETWVTDYSLTSDSKGNAICVFNDIRTGNFNVFAYKISPEGNFLWGENGIAVSHSGDTNITPKLAITAGDNAFIAWERINHEDTQGKVVLQRLSSEGDIMWGEGIIIEGSNGKRAVKPQIVPGEDDSVIVIWMETPDSMSYDRTIFARKLDPTGTTVWTSDVQVTFEQQIPFFYDIIAEPDSSGGVFIVWQAITAEDLTKSFIQHINYDGTVSMTTGGIPLSTSSLTQQINPSISFAKSTGEIITGWEEQNRNQTEYGIYVQRFTPDGSRGWNENGFAAIPVSSEVLILGGIGEFDNGIVIIYGAFSFDNFMDVSISGGLITLDEEPIWEQTTLSGSQSPKSHLIMNRIEGCGYWVAWDDARNDMGDVHASFITAK